MTAAVSDLALRTSQSWFLGGVLGCLLGFLALLGGYPWHHLGAYENIKKQLVFVLVSAFGVLWAAFEVLGGSLGSPWRVLVGSWGALEGPWGSVGRSLGPLGGTLVIRNEENEPS